MIGFQFFDDGDDDSDDDDNPQLEVGCVECASGKDDSDCYEMPGLFLSLSFVFANLQNLVDHPLVQHFLNSFEIDCGDSEEEGNNNEV